MRTIKDQLADITAGCMTADQVVAEGVHDYALKYYEAQTVEEAVALDAIRAVIKDKPVDKSVDKPVDKPPSAPMTMCSCGHTTPCPMNTSRGTACPNCYDRMS